MISKTSLMIGLQMVKYSYQKVNHDDIAIVRFDNNLADELA